MARFLKDRTNAKGQAPGSLVFIGNQKMDKPVVQLIKYDSETFSEEELDSVEEAFTNLSSDGVNWINIYGIHDLEMIKSLGEHFKIPSLLLEDILNTDQRPGYQDGQDYDAFILKMLHHDPKANRINADQISIILGENYLLTLQENRGDVFTHVRERIRKSLGRIRLHDNDYLAYILMDTIVDNYTFLIENIGRKVEDLEDRIFLKKDTKVVEEIYMHKTELNYLRKTVRPVKDLILSLLKTENSYFHEKNRQYLLDLNDLVHQSTEAIELYNNLISDQLNIYNTSVGNGMNEVMKVLTIFAAVFIPLSFIAGIYGMNFEYMPELKYKYAYGIFWLVILIVGGGLLVFFKRKKWL
ncbi:magnesium/cobalt transporter CorA [Draconibacterium sp.]|nr:magnesium/cobalt transporter CorA [Draconibacterium sp.]